MKRVNRKDFLQMPVGTMFFTQSSIQDALFLGDLCVKGKNIGSVDFYVNNLNEPYIESDDSSLNEDSVFMSHLLSGNDMELDFNNEYARGNKGDEEYYYVLSKKDVKSLLDKINNVYKSYKDA